MTAKLWVNAVHALSHAPILTLPMEMQRALRRADPLITWAVAAAHAALKKAPGRNLPNDAIAIVAANAYGPSETSLRFLDEIAEFGEGNGSPFLFAHSVPNAMAGYIGWLEQIQGSTFTLSDFHWPLPAALQTAWHLRQSHSAQRFVVVVAEQESPFIRDGIGAADFQSPLGAVAWILDNRPTKSRQSWQLHPPQLQTHPCAPEALFHRQGEQWYGNHLPAATGKTPLDHALALTHALEKAPSETVHWRLQAVFGQAHLTFSPTFSGN